MADLRDSYTSPNITVVIKSTGKKLTVHAGRMGEKLNIYEGESNENLKFVIKNRNFAPLSCKLVRVLQTACIMACRWQHSADARTPSQYQYKDGCPT